MLFRHKAEVSVRNIKAAMCRCNVGVLNVLVIENTELPVRIFLSVDVLVVCDLTENGDLLNKCLQGAHMNRECGPCLILVDALLLVCLEFVQPDTNNLLQLGTCQITERGILADGLVRAALVLLL
jgi:hypothetical protein